MAGFFGLFNYEKEGPGIAKNAPRKKTFIIFFETFFRNFWKFIPLNLIYGLICIPFVTGGIASVGMTNVARNIARDKHSFGLSDFFDTIKKNWKQALGAGVLNFVLSAVLAFDLYYFILGGASGVMASIGLGVSICVLFIFQVMNFYIWTLMITFKLTIKQIYKNSFQFVFLNMKMNLFCLLILLICYAIFAAIILFLGNPIIWFFAAVLALICFPAFRFLLIQFCTFPAIKKYIIDPYYEEHPDEDIEKRKSLGIEVEEPKSEQEETDEDSESEEIVFED